MRRILDGKRKNEMANPQVFSLQALANQITDSDNVDILFFNSAIERGKDRKIIQMVGKRQRRKNIMLILVTNGGNPDAAFRISRCLQEKYEKFSVFIPGICKSAGTLVALGANEIIVSDCGELGPLDVQMQKADELWEMSSGLTDLTALQMLQGRAFAMFERAFLDLKERSGGRITLRTAMEVSSTLMSGLYGPIFSQIDPIRLGEISRAMNIGMEYGQRLERKGKNLKATALFKLTAEYPSHGFCIDRTEAEGLFTKLRKPTDNESKLAECLGNEAYCESEENSFIEFLSEELVASSLPDNKDGGGNEKRIDSGFRKNSEGKGKKVSQVAKPTGPAATNGKGRGIGQAKEQGSKRGMR